MKRNEKTINRKIDFVNRGVTNGTFYAGPFYVLTIIPPFIFGVLYLAPKAKAGKVSHGDVKKCIKYLERKGIDTSQGKQDK